MPSEVSYPCTACSDPTKCRRAHGTDSAYGKRHGCRCTDCKAGNAARARAYAKMAKERDGLSPTQKARPAHRKPCASCGKMIRGSDSITYCKPCGATKYNDRRSAERKMNQAQARLRKAAKGTRASAKWPWVQGFCARCGDYFLRKGQASPYCSGMCNRGYDKARTRSFISKAGRLAIYERDKWTCQICGELVSVNVDYLDPRYPTLDHIEPQSHALIPDHSPRNLRLAHRICNALRQDQWDGKRPRRRALAA